MQRTATGFICPRCGNVRTADFCGYCHEHRPLKLAAPAAAMVAAVDAQAARVVLIEIRNVYGALKAYPMNDAARVLAEIAGTKTLSRAVLSRVGLLGFEIVSAADCDWRKVS